MLIIEYELEQHTDMIVVRYKESMTTGDWERIVVDAKTLALLLRGWGIIACPHKDNGTMPNLDNGTINRNAPMLYCGAPLHMPCGNRCYNCIDMKEFTATK